LTIEHNGGQSLCHHRISIALLLICRIHHHSQHHILRNQLSPLKESRDIQPCLVGRASLNTSWRMPTLS
jgi:hypothetical protein